MVAATRSRTNKSVQVETLKIETVEPDLKVTKPKKSPTKKASKPKVPKLDLEESLSHIQIPPDNSLPESFVKYHAPDFIEGVKHIIRKDPSLYPVIVYKNFDFYEDRPRPVLSDKELIVSYWYSLITSVLGQQVSGASAKAVETKFKALFVDEEITPANTLKKTPEQLRSAGFSGQKLGYTYHISEVFANPDSNLSKVSFYSNPIDVVIEELTTLKGIGHWSAKMFAMFTLRDLDVFTYDDLGVARGISRYFVRRPTLFQEIKQRVNESEESKALLKKKSKFEKKDSRRDWIPYHDEYVKHCGLSFSPYQSVLMLIMWRLGSTNIEILESTGIKKEQNGLLDY